MTAQQVTYFRSGAAPKTGSSLDRASRILDAVDMGDPHEITDILQLWREGDPRALEQLTPLVFDQLQVIARAYMRRERVDHTLQPTALVSELYLRLVGQRQANWADRAHFYAFSARMMRNILSDYARKHLSESRGGAMALRLPLSEDVAWVGSTPEETLALDEALEQLDKLDPRKARVIELRCFLALSMQETADVLDLSLATAERDLRFARSWLFRALHSGASSSSSPTLRPAGADS